MNTLENYKNEALKLLSISINNELTKWYQKYDYEYKSPIYNNFSFLVNTSDKKIRICKEGKLGVDKDLLLINYKNIISYKNYKIKILVKKLIKYFKDIKKNKKNKEDIAFINSGLNDIKKNFPQEIRREKLKKIS